MVKSLQFKSRPQLYGEAEVNISKANDSKSNFGGVIFFFAPHGIIVLDQQFTCGVVREASKGVIAKTFPQMSAKIPQTFCRISTLFPDAIKIQRFFFANFSAKLSRNKNLC